MRPIRYQVGLGTFQRGAARGAGASDFDLMAEKEWFWTKKRELAAQLLAQNPLSFKEICEQVGVSDQALRNWRKHPEFKKRVDDLAAQFREEVRSRGIAIVENRVHDLDEMRRRIWDLIRARGKDPQMQDVPGGSSGLLVHRIKSVGSGESATMVDEYEVDGAVLKEFRAYLEQAAKQLGQWTDKSEIGSPGGGPLLEALKVVYVATQNPEAK